ncbi:MAG: hypothetical protein L6R35_005829, partial [Caloplaca aegaea]
MPTTMMLSSDAATTVLPLTFGIEFEHILAFHSSLLLPHLPPSTRIIKDIPLSTREALRQTSIQYLCTRSYYNGWALTSPTAYPLPRGPRFHNECLDKNGCRGYGDEVLKIERDILIAASATDAVVQESEHKTQRFERWHLTTDNSLVGASHEALTEIIGTNRIETREWDSAPLELVSPPFPLDEEASFEEIATVLAAVRGTNLDHHQAFIDQWCGLHVHIGLPPSSTDETFPLPLLQHLAYITLVYEPAISSLFPPQRRPDRDDTGMDLGSNRDLFLPEPDYSNVDWDAVEMVSDSGYASDDEAEEEGVYVELPKKGGGGRGTTTTPTSPSSAAAATAAESEDHAYEVRIQQKAQTTLFAPAQTLHGLCHAMSSGGQRGRLVNWTYLARNPDNGPRTLEFRQHEGCLDAREVRGWVRFCGALVRWAAEMGAKEEERGLELE